MAKGKWKYIDDDVEDAIADFEKKTGKQVSTYRDTGDGTRVYPEKGGGNNQWVYSDLPKGRGIKKDWIPMYRALVAAFIAEEINPADVSAAMLEREIRQWFKGNGPPISRSAAREHAELIMDEVKKLNS